ncbi:SusC/RagA family TonB-linked outer membrane protein [Mucilaginibacter lacusdianchii]|uniref:SusC/RagA family TonB-linked outer membrane protein n=1 Tax=Mucilaginibacter lacusdianchii TaxID=2684211 RepID=UPI00131D3672|nr:SusC/RagA family TonB-linked outer membrane protein [Mucilaginibacter sp. JXJ CY 39]
MTNGYAAMQDTTARTAPYTNGPKGVVVDEYGVPLKGVKITVKAKPDVVTTDNSGKFAINAAQGDILVFALKNFYVRQVKLNRQDTLRVRLIPTYLKSPDRIDVLYGTADPKNTLGSIATLYTNQLTTTPSTLYSYALPGQLPGLYTQQYSGFASPSTASQTKADLIGNVVQHNNYSANDNTEIGLFLRGNTPITIIDNVQREISSIDPESIESISVLKDALSTMLLGNNSSRGVLLVTTKRPEMGKPRISFTAQTALQQPLGLPTPLPAYQYAYLYNEALQNDKRQPIYSSADFSAYRDQTDPYRHPDVNWFKTLLRDYSPLTSYRLNVNGGTQVARYTISLNYLDQAGMFKTASSSPYNTNNDLSRYMINSDLSVNVTKNLNVDLQLFGRIQQFTQPGTGYGGILNALFTTPNNAYPVYNPNNTFGGTTVYTNNLLSQTQYSGYQRVNSNDVLANLDLNYDLSGVTPGLSVKGKGNLAFSSQGLTNRSLQNNTYLFGGGNAYSPVGSPFTQSNTFGTISSARYAYAQGTVNYDRSFGKHNVSGLFLYDYRSVVLNYDLSQGTTNRALKGAYNYDGKYFIEAVVNNSGYSRYPPGHQFGMFYAGGLGWQMARESFIKDNFGWINSWKWRVTYGQTGNANVDNYGYFNFLQTYSRPIGYPYTTGTNRSGVQIYAEDLLANPNISWEKAHKLDIGADIALFKDHFKITADYYRDRYYNLLQIRGASIALLGTNYAYENIGVNLNKGGELSLTYQNNAGNFNYFITGNASVQSTKAVFKDEPANPYPWTRYTGQRTDVIFGYKALGFFQNAQEAAASATTLGYTPQAGDVKYADLNNDGVINQFDQTPIGNTKPLIFYGTTLGFNYKGFSLSVILQGVKNHDILFNNALANGFSDFSGLTYSGQGYDLLNARWTPETATTATQPRLSLGNPNNTAWSSLYIRSGNYFRLKNAEVGYNLPSQWVRRLRISGVRLFANGENLLTLYGYKGVDPEVYGVAYPIQRVFNAGVNIKL